jgi:hypothetical protein
MAAAQTALAWGNSFGDIFANVALASHGRAKVLHPHRGAWANLHINRRGNPTFHF